MNYIEVLEITKDNLQEAQFMSSNYIDKTVSNRIFFNVIAAEAFCSYLKNFGVDIDDLASIHSIKRVIDKVDIADIILPNIHIDVRVIFQDDVIFIPKSHFSYGIVPDIYVVLKYDRNFQRINLLGYFEPSVINLSNSNDEYYFLEPEKLQSPIDIIDFILNFNGNTLKPVTQQQVERVRELSVAVADHDVTPEEFKEFLYLISISSDLRNTVIEYDNFETLAYGVTSAINRLAALKATQNDVVDINDFMGFADSDNVSELKAEPNAEESTNAQSSFQVEDANGDSMLDEVDEVSEPIVSPADGLAIEPVIASDEAVELAAVAGDIVNNSDINSEVTSEDISDIPEDNFTQDELFEDDIDDENKSDIVENIDSESSESILTGQNDSNELSDENLSDIEADFSDFGEDLSEQVLDDFNTEDDAKPIDSPATDDLGLSNLTLDDGNLVDNISEEQEAQDLLMNTSDIEELVTGEPLSDIPDIDEFASEEPISAQEESVEDANSDVITADVKEDEFSDTTEDVSADITNIDELSLDFDEDNLDLGEENNPETSLTQEDEVAEESIDVDSTVNTDDLSTQLSDIDVIEDYELRDDSFDIDDSIITTAPNLENISEDIEGSLNIEGDISVLPSEDAFEEIEQNAPVEGIDESDIESSVEPQSFEDLSDNENIEKLDVENEGALESLEMDDINDDTLSGQESAVSGDEILYESESTVFPAEEKDGENDDTFELDLNEFEEDKNDGDNTVYPEEDEYQIDISALPLEDVPSAPDEEIHTVDPSDIFAVENSVETENDIDTSYNQELPIDEDGVQNSETLESNDTDNAHDLDNLPLAELEEQPGDSEASLVSFSDITDTPTVEPYNAEVSFETMDDFSDFETLIPSEDNSNSDVDYNDEDSESQAEFFSTPVISENSVVISDKNHTPGEIFIDINKDSSNPDVPVENEHLEELYNNENSSAENIGLNNEVRVTKGSGSTLPIFVGVGGIALVLLLVGIIFFSVSKYINPTTKDNEPIVAEGNPVQSNLGTDVPTTSNVNNNVVMNNTQSGTARPNNTQNQETAQIPSQPTKPIPATAFLSVRKLSWEVPDYISYDANFKQYFQSSGKSLKAALNSDLLLATDYTYSDQVRVSILFAKDGTFKQAKILLSSGSSQVDNIVLQSVNQTLRVLKAPNSLGNDESTTVILKIYI